MNKSLLTGVALLVVAWFAVRAPAQESTAPRVDLEKRAADLVDHLAAGNWAEASRHFDAVMRTAAPADRLAEIWKSAEDRLGAFQARSGRRRERFKKYEFVFVTCRFEKATIDVKVVFNATGEIGGLFFVTHRDTTPYEAPAYVRAEAVREVACEFGEPEWRLPGTLSLPKGDGPSAAVVLVHGSGPNDRDETIGPNKPFKDLAGGLATRGVAVLRYDKRTKVHGPRMANLENLTVKEETVDDAVAAVEWLRGRSEIDRGRIFVLGHSLGAMLVPRIARRTDAVAGYLILAGPTRPLEEVVLAQFGYLFSLDGKISAAERKRLEALQKQVERVREPELATTTPRGDLPLGLPAPYWLDLRGYRPAEAARTLRRPLLILQGERDYQVTLTDFEGWKQALADRSDVTFVRFPALNHLFIRGEGRSTPQEYEKVGHVDEKVIAAIADWIRRVKP